MATPPSDFTLQTSNLLLPPAPSSLRNVEQACSTGKEIPDAATAPSAAGRRPHARQRRDLVRIERPHEARRNQHEQLSALRTIRLRLEDRADDRNLAQVRNVRAIFLSDVVEQTGDGERLAVAKLDFRLRVARRQSRHARARV